MVGGKSLLDFAYSGSNAMRLVSESEDGEIDFRRHGCDCFSMGNCAEEKEAFLRAVR